MRHISSRRDHWGTCSHACQVIRDSLNHAQNVTAVTGNGNLWAAAVELNDAYSAYIGIERAAYKASREDGMTDAEWWGLKAGPSSTR